MQKLIAHLLISFAMLAPLSGNAGAKSIPPGLTWNWDLEGGIPGGADIIDYDPKLGSGNKSRIQRNGARIVICYFSAGSWENGRPDMGGLRSGIDYKNPLKGGNEGGQWKANGQPERWVNIDSPAVRSVMVGRLVDAKERGCDAVEPDNLDGDLSQDNASGFEKSPSQVLAYYRFLADEAHKLGLSIGLKNADDLASTASSIFDFVIIEECLQNNECHKYRPFLQKGKAVLIAEYSSSQELCKKAKSSFQKDSLNGASITVFPSDRMVKNGRPCRF